MCYIITGGFNKNRLFILDAFYKFFEVEHGKNLCYFLCGGF